MKRFRIVGICLIAIFAFSAVAAASASAEEWYVTAKKLSTYTPATKEIKSTPMPVTNGLLKGDGIEITCKKVAVEKGLIEVGGKGKAEHLKFTECKVDNAANCVINPGSSAGTISTNAVTAVAKLTTSPAATVEFKGTGEESEFTNIKIGNEGEETCLVKSSEGYKVRGCAIIESPNLGEEKVEHSGKITTSTGCKLTINKNAATITGELVTLTEELKLVGEPVWGLKTS
jgi:hypothetical protein